MAQFYNKKRFIDTDTMSIRFAQVLEEKGLNSYTAEPIIGKTRAMIEHLATGRRKFTIETACEVCKALDIDVIWFITGFKIK
jgi:plasmid maintenance system antidote protein VapI